MPKYGIKTSFQTGGTSMAELPWWQAPYIVIFILQDSLTVQAPTHTYPQTGTRARAQTYTHTSLLTVLLILQNSPRLLY